MDRPADRIGVYRLGRHLGGGSYAEVYEALDERTGRRCAVKIVHRGLSRDREVAYRVKKEVQAVNRVRHPGIVEIYDHGRLTDGTLYIVMEYLSGQALYRRMRFLERGQVVRIGQRIAGALSAAHALGVIHRDLKPENVMLVRDPEAPDGERVKVLDFGIAKVLRRAADASDEMWTAVGVAMGTPLYMPPEQAQDAGAVTDRADVYALGVMLYQMLARRPPLTASSPSELMAMQVYRTPRPLGEVNPEVPEALCELVGAMLAKSPQRRPSMAEVAARLQALDQEDAGAGGSSPGPGGLRVGGAVTAIALGLVLLGLAAWWGQGAEAPAPATAGVSAAEAPRVVLKEP